MLLFFKIIFGISVFGLVHSYLLYPMILKVLARGKKQNTNCFKPEDDLPLVSVIMAVYNEEAVIREKMESLLALDYPTDKLRIYIGSDCSDDQTNAILKNYQSEVEHLRFFPFTQRRGKPGVVNELTEKTFAENGQSPEHILLLTDASVMLRPDTLFEMIQHFRNPEIMIVDSNMVNQESTAKGISKLEKQYISSEVNIKHLESLAFGKMIGPFGGCYTIRSTHFSPIPDKFLVDDFYITMRAFEQGGLAINELKAVCYEKLPDALSEEYRRKARISAGNFQNLQTFAHLLWRGDALSFAFFSHKVLRWLGPFFIIFAGLSAFSLALLSNNGWSYVFIIMIVIGIGFPLLDFLFKKMHINVLLFRGLRYFLMMNIALLEGFFNYLKGIKNNVWQPTNRE